MSNMTLIDSHVHLWDTARLDYPWLTGIPAIDSPHLPGEYRDASEGYDVEKLVFVRCPDVRFVLDHIGKPFIAEGIVEPWAGYIGQLAEASNVFCKIGGVTTEAVWESWSPDSLRPYTDIVFEAFGFDRVMFGGDWPVVNLSSTWSAWVESLDELVAEIGEEVRRRLFHDNAAAFYRL